MGRSLVSAPVSLMGGVQSGEFFQIVRDHDLGEAPCDGDHVLPGECLWILRVGTARRLGSSGVERDTPLTHSP